MVMRTTARVVLLFVLSICVAGGGTPVAPAFAQDKEKDAPQAALVGVDTVIAEQARQTVPVIGRLVAQQ